MNKKIKLEVINVTELDPSKSYFVELDGRSYSREDAETLLSVFKDIKVSAAVAISVGGNLTFIKELPKESNHE